MKKIMFISAFFMFTFSFVNAYSCEQNIQDQMNQMEQNQRVATKNLKLIETAVADSELDYCDTGHSFLLLLEGLGTNNTRAIRKVFSDLVVVAKHERANLSGYVYEVLQIYSLENSLFDFRGNVSMVKNSALKNHITAIYGFRIFVRELRYSGGSTFKARKMYKMYVERNRNRL